MPTYRTAVVDVVHNDDEIRLNLDLLEERRERAAIREAKAKKAQTKIGRTLRGHRSTRRWSVQAKVYGRSGPSADVEHRQPQEMLSLSHDSRMYWVRD
ncbi:hypothetical protein Tco_1004017 [Tanacetum coccineum]|uniref:Uncharacterized protein n=1 Tax=Tanacetum coccineum TaxID=301880 RepID=A0ABQ5FBT3_9ASTR